MHKTQTKKNFFSALLIAFLDNFGYSFVFILFAPLLLEPSYGILSNHLTLGMKNILLGLLIAAFPLLTFLGAPFWGDYADRFGRKKALIFTILGTVLGHILSAVAIYFQSYLFLLLARAMAGFFSGNVSICLAIVSDLSPNEKLKGRNFGMFWVAMACGWIISMVMGGDLSDPTRSKYFSPYLPFAIAAILTFMGYLVVRFFFSETHKQEKGVRFDFLKSIHDIMAALRIAEIRSFLLIILFWTLGWYFTFQWYTAISIERFHVTQELASFYLIILGAIWVIGGVIINPILVKKFSSLTLSIASVILMAFFIFLASISTNYLFFSLFIWIATLPAPIAVTHLINLVSMTAPAKVQGKAMGFTQAFQALGGVLVPITGGVIARFNITAIFFIAAILLLIAFLLLFFERRFAKNSKHGK